jgi:hypothetical protein
MDDNVSGNQCIETFNEIEVRRIRRATTDRTCNCGRAISVHSGWQSLSVVIVMQNWSPKC